MEQVSELRRRLGKAEVATQQGQVRRERLPAAAPAAQALRPVRVDGDMAELARGVVVPTHDLPVYHDTGSYTVRDGHIHEIAHALAALAEPHLA